MLLLFIEDNSILKPTVLNEEKNKKVKRKSNQLISGVYS
jgi:hypothetical protein